MESCPDEAVELILKKLTCANARVAFGSVSRRMLACARAVGLDGTVREGRYGNFRDCVASLAVGADGKSLAVFTQNDLICRIEVFDMRTGALLQSHNEYGMRSSIAFSPDGQRFVGIEEVSPCPCLRIYPARAGDSEASLRSLSTLPPRAPNVAGADLGAASNEADLVAWGPLGVCAIFRDRAQLWDSRDLDAPPRVAAAPWDLSEYPACVELTATHALVATRYSSYPDGERRPSKLWRLPFDGPPATEIPVAASDPRLLLSQAPARVFDTPRGVLLITSAGNAFCVRRDGAVEEFALGINVDDCCADAGRGSVFAATRAGVVRVRAATDGWHVSEAVGDPCTSIACLPSCLVTAHVDWGDVTVFSPTFTERVAAPRAALPPPYDHDSSGGLHARYGEREHLSSSASHDFVMKNLTANFESLLQCVHTRSGDVAYATMMEGTVRAALPVTATEAITVTVNYGRGRCDHHETLVELVRPNHKVELACPKQHFEGRSLLHCGTLYLVGRAGVSMIEGVLGDGPLAVVSLTRKTCVSVRVELGGKRIVGTLLGGGDIVLVAPRGVFARLG